MNTEAKEISRLQRLKRLHLEEGSISVEQRLHTLKQFEKLLRDSQKEIEGALFLDLGKSDTDAFSTEILFTLSELAILKKNLARWSKPRRVPTPLFFQPAKSYILPEPYGVVLVIAPWNYPFQLAVVPILGAIAAGNRVVLKPSEVATHTEQLLSTLISKYISTDYVEVVCGGPDVTGLLIDEKPDKIFFTGSPSTGSIIMQMAARHLIPVTLELGGKSPCLVDETADLSVSARRIVWGKFINAGQTCISPDYILVHKSISAAFQMELAKKIDQMYPDAGESMGKIINKRHFERLRVMLKGNITRGGNSDPEALRIEPTLILNPEAGHPCMQEEIFGPILPVIEYDNLEAAIRFINEREKPLAFYIFSRSGETIKKATRSISAGGICINDTLLHIVNAHLPFGGVGQSGMGVYHGKYSFETFSHMKPVLHKKTWFDPSFRYPPNHYLLKKLEKLMLMLSH
jgi:aldehyde dehydrogenase (NAD+)